jgi:hypothetical protein
MGFEAERLDMGESGGGGKDQAAKKAKRQKRIFSHRGFLLKFGSFNLGWRSKLLPGQVKPALRKSKIVA